MNAHSSRFRLFGVFIAAAALAGTPGTPAQAADSGARKASATATSKSAAETPRERGRRRKDAGEPVATTTATAPAAAAFPVEPNSKADGSEIVCKYEALTGTKVKQKICGTAAQWAESRRRNQANVDEVTRKTRQGAVIVARPDQTQIQTPPSTLSP